MDKIIDWFDKNYIEEKGTIFKILEEASIKHSCSFKSLFESCQIMKQTSPGKTSLRQEVQYFAKLADHGIRGSYAGKKLRLYLMSNISKETIEALNEMVELAYNKILVDEPKPERMSGSRARKLYAIVKLSQSGYAGVLPDGKIVDRREFPDSIPVEKNNSMGIPKPKSIG